MRLFVAVFPPAHALEHLSTLVAQLPLTRRAVPPERWHLTLAFLGEVDPQLEPAAHKALEASVAALSVPARAHNAMPPSGRGEARGGDPLLSGGRGQARVVDPGAARGAGGPRVGELTVAGGGHFGPVVWAGIEGDVDGLTRLSRAVRREMRARRLHPDDKRFKPHLTLARSDAEMSTSDYERLREYRGPSWPVTEVVLVRSIMGPQPAYHPLGSWQLR